MKYTPEQLQEMAAEFMGQLTGHNDVRCHQLVGAMSQQLNMHPDQVVTGIHMLAMGMQFGVNRAAA
jgi:hypothetical protein